MRATLIDGLLSCQGRLRRSRERHIHAMNPPPAPGKGRRGAIVSWNGGRLACANRRDLRSLRRRQPEAARIGCRRAAGRAPGPAASTRAGEIGRASGREGGGQYGEVSGVGVSVKKKKKE